MKVPMRRNEVANQQPPQSRCRDNRPKDLAVRRQAEEESPREAPALAVT